MKEYQALFFIAIMLTVASSKPVNLTDFWSQQLKNPQIQFQSYAGYQQIDWYRKSETSGIYYQLFGARSFDLQSINPKVPLILWLQGGPGASSLFGAYTEVGPIQIVQQVAKAKPTSWNLLGHLLFVDQPLNVGFSFDEQRESDKQVNSVAEAGEHLLNFLYNFYRQWPNLQASPLYIVGQSFGGRYASKLANLIKANSTFKSEIKVTVTGVIISSGWMDPINQLNFYDSLLYSTGIVSNRFRDICSSFQTKGMVDMYKKNYQNASDYFDFLTRTPNISNQYWGGMSFLNFRQYEDEDYSMDTYVQKYKKQLGVKQGINYIPQNDKVYYSFKEELMKSSTKELITTINSVRTLIYNGQNDYIVNTAGVQNYLNSLNWVSINGWKNSKKNIWFVHSEIKGWVKTFKNLWFAVVNGAGHKVTTDQPESCFNLLGHFVRDNQQWQ